MTALLLLVATLSAVFGQGRYATALYNQGNALYREGRYEAAAARYEAALEAGLRHGHVYYNLGNAWFKAGALGRAILSYERGLRLMPTDPDLVANLAFVNERRVDRIELPEANVITRALLDLYAGLNVDLLALSCVAELYGLCGLAIARLFGRARPALLAGMVAFGLLFAGSGAVLALKAGDRAAVEAVILSAEAVARSGPGDDFLQVLTLHEGTKVTVERTEGSWVLVRLSNGLGGWAPLSSLSVI